ncbi:GxxExxY protein [Brumimicrobium mesophilum]|uniref:GxxExxY protein n=1 Tax=Brumimicrobium mesophilum TaxID=392717 RepID=UPI000D143912|nr:GxxExxY protein [Brumimicrobium mesophilum]
MNLIHKDLTNKIIKPFYDVYNELGHGFLEKVYQNALFIELKNRGFYVEAQKQIKVYYKNHQVGEYYADLIIDEVVVLELKATEVIIKEFEFQLINYLKATEIEVGLLLNFGVQPEFKRKVFSNKHHASL